MTAKGTTQIKSRQRVAERGEVFTAEREVNAMLDLVKPETERIDATFLEPSCGTGNFLAEILNRKLKAAEQQKHGVLRDRRMDMFASLSLLAVSSIYGIDIMADNVSESRQRLLDILCQWYETATRGLYPMRNGADGYLPSDELRKAWQYILEQNIQQGDFLKMQHPDTHEPLIIRQWLIDGHHIHYTDHRLSDLIHEPHKQLSLW